jgi:hypothetical protein
MTHFLNTPAARSLSIAQVLRLSDEEAFDTFKRVRFAANGGEAFLPALRHCQGLYACRDADRLEVFCVSNAGSRNGSYEPREFGKHPPRSVKACLFQSFQHVVARLLRAEL